MAGPASRGCVVAATRGTGITDDPELFNTPPAAKHRFHLAGVAAVVRGGLHVGSVYLKDSIGVAHDNLDGRQEIAIAIRARVGPSIIGGDWGITPTALAASGWLDLVGGVSVAEDLPTCCSHCCDYFVVAKWLRHAVVSVGKGRGRRPTQAPRAAARQVCNDRGQPPLWPAAGPALAGLPEACGGRWRVIARHEAVGNTCTREVGLIHRRPTAIGSPSSRGVLPLDIWPACTPGPACTLCFGVCQAHARSCHCPRAWRASAGGRQASEHGGCLAPCDVGARAAGPAALPGARAGVPP